VGEPRALGPLVAVSSTRALGQGLAIRTLLPVSAHEASSLSVGTTCSGASDRSLHALSAFGS